MARFGYYHHKYVTVMERRLFIMLFLFVSLYAWRSEANNSDLIPVCVEESAGKDVNDDALKPSSIQDLETSRKCIVACLKRKRPKPCKAAVFRSGTCRLYSENAKEVPKAFIEGDNYVSYYEVLDNCPIGPEKRHRKITNIEQAHFLNSNVRKDENSDSILNGNEITENKIDFKPPAIAPPMKKISKAITTDIPETTVPETTVPETTLPETTVPETTLPETTVIRTTTDKSELETTPPLERRRELETTPLVEKRREFETSVNDAEPQDDQKKTNAAQGNKEEYKGWSPWTDWTSCNCEFGRGTKSRSRTCLDATPKLCNGDSSMSEDCYCPKPEWGGWSKWTECSVTCGGGKQIRTRNCTKPNYCTGAPIDEQPCGNVSCHHWEPWSKWGSCSVTCDVGVQLRTRACQGFDNKYGTGGCIGAASQQQVCSMPPCCTEWGPWQECTQSCGTGNQTRTRNCTYDEGPAGTIKPGSMAEQDAMLKQGGRFKRQGLRPVETTQSRRCAGGACPSWNPWGPLGPCSVTCGAGTKKRVRQCVTERTVVKDSDCPGNKIEYVTCEAGPCPKWSSWSPWSECSVTCGYGETTRTRACENAIAAAAAAAAGVPPKECTGVVTETVACKPGDCVKWQSWSPWTQCSVTCGMGQRNRSRICTGPGGKIPGGGSGGPGPGPGPTPPECQGETEEVVPCDMGPCAHYSSWSPWSQCSTTCGPGEQTRIRQCEHGVECVGQEQDIRPCPDVPECKQWCGWQSWTQCSATCGPGIRKRQRLCSLPGTCAGQQKPYGYGGYPTPAPYGYAGGGYPSPVPPTSGGYGPPALPTVAPYQPPPPPTVYGYATPPPAYPTPPPVTVGGYPTPAPAYPTPAPAYPTPAPAYFTPAPAYPTPAPAYPTPPPPQYGYAVGGYPTAPPATIAAYQTPAPPTMGGYPTPAPAYPTPPPPTVAAYPTPAPAYPTPPPPTVGGYPTPAPAYPTPPPTLPVYAMPQPTIAVYPTPLPPTVGYQTPAPQTIRAYATPPPPTVAYGTPAPVVLTYGVRPSGYDTVGSFGSLGDAGAVDQQAVFKIRKLRSMPMFMETMSIENMTLDNFTLHGLEDFIFNMTFGNMTLNDTTGMKTQREPCIGESEIIEPCSSGPCPEWTQWKEWSSCSATCGVGQFTRSRVCGGGYCYGDSSETKPCTVCRCPTWTEWGPWSACSSSCGYGTRTRNRQCPNECQPNYGYGYSSLYAGGLADSVVPDNSTNMTNINKNLHRQRRQGAVLDDGMAGMAAMTGTADGGGTSSNCYGETQQTETCDKPCSQWTQWEEWSTCTVSCGNGQQARMRSCSGGSDCQGSTFETITCNREPCPTSAPYYQPPPPPAYQTPPPPAYQTPPPPAYPTPPPPAYPTPPPPAYPAPPPVYPTPPPAYPTPPPYQSPPPPAYATYTKSPPSSYEILQPPPPAYSNPAPTQGYGPPSQPPPAYIPAPTPALSYPLQSGLYNRKRSRIRHL